MSTDDLEEGKVASILHGATETAGQVAHSVGQGLKSAARAAGGALQSLGETDESIAARERAEREAAEAQAEQKAAIAALTEANASLRALTKPAARSKPAAAKAKTSRPRTKAPVR
jgi:hypothetical protein